MHSYTHHMNILKGFRKGDVHGALAIDINQQSAEEGRGKLLFTYPGPSTKFGRIVIIALHRRYRRQGEPNRHSLKKS